MSRRGTSSRAGVVAICLVALALVGAGCGGGGDSGSSTVAAATSRAGEATVILHELRGSGASGTAVYSENAYHVPIKIELEGLEEASGENQYVLWEVVKEAGKRELGSYHVPASGQLRIDLVSTYLYSLNEAEQTELLLTRVKSDDYLRERQAESAGPEKYVGERVARGGLSETES